MAFCLRRSPPVVPGPRVVRASPALALQVAGAAEVTQVGAAFMPSAPPVLFDRAAVRAPVSIVAVPLYRAVREIEHLRPTVFPPWIDVGHGSSSDCAALVAAYLDRGPTPRVVQSARGQSPLDGTQLGMRSEQLRKYPSGHLYPPAVTERAHPAFRGPRAELGRLTPPGSHADSHESDTP